MIDREQSGIIICPECEGTGKVEERRNLYESETRVCPRCEGHRVLLKQVDVTYQKVH